MNETNFSLDDYLAHHGIRGQKWGERNGPPYPLGSDISTGKRLKTAAGDAVKKAKKTFDDSVSKYKAKRAERKEAEEKKKAEAAQKAKEKTIARSDAKEIDKIKETLTTKEFEEAVKRAELNKRLQQADTSKSKLQKITNALNTTAKVTGAGIAAWNNLAKISNAFTDSDLPIIGEKKQKQEEKPQDKLRHNAEMEYSANGYRYYLAHHGIRGQKWGQRNGPPYPLDSSVSTGKTLRSSIKYGSSDKKLDDLHTKKNDENYSDSKKQTAKYLAKLALDVVTMNPVGLASDAKRLADAGAASAKNAKFNKEKEGEKIDPKTGFFLKNDSMTAEEDLKRVNPSFKNFDSNTKSNCMLCTITYDLRRRGYDVTAKTASEGFFTSELTKWYPKAEVKTITGENTTNSRINDRQKKVKNAIDTFTSDALAQGNGARGNIMVTWYPLTGGHSMAYEVNNGSVSILDAQSNKVYKNPYQILKGTDGVFEYARLDNVDFDPEAIKRCCR